MSGKRPAGSYSQSAMAQIQPISTFLFANIQLTVTTWSNLSDHEGRRLTGTHSGVMHEAQASTCFEPSSEDGNADADEPIAKKSRFG